MNNQYMALLGSVDLQPTLRRVQNDAPLGFAEYSMLRDSAEAKLYQLMSRVRARQGSSASFDGEEALQHLQEASLRMAHLLQTSCLALRRLGLEHQDKQLARQALEYQLAYMQACLRRSMASFGEY